MSGCSGAAAQGDVRLDGAVMVSAWSETVAAGVTIATCQAAFEWAGFGAMHLGAIVTGRKVSVRIAAEGKPRIVKGLVASDQTTGAQVVICGLSGDDVLATVTMPIDGPCTPADIAARIGEVIEIDDQVWRDVWAPGTWADVEVRS